MMSSIFFDLHTHSVSSGHGSNDTITTMVNKAKSLGLLALGISEHAPATPGSAKESYFRSLALASRSHSGIQLLYGVELNILNQHGEVDLADDVLDGLDYAIISYHLPTCSPMSIEDNTLGYIRAMEHKKVRFIGHMDDGRYPVDFKKVLIHAKERDVYPEINNMSLAPDAYRTNGKENSKVILQICKELNLPVLLSSDSHGAKQIGNIKYILPILEEVDFPKHLILNLQSVFLNKLI